MSSQCDDAGPFKRSTYVAGTVYRHISVVNAGNNNDVMVLPIATIEV